jgi:hypothetical protein
MWKSAHQHSSVPGRCRDLCEMEFRSWHGISWLGLYCFSQSLHSNAGIVPQNKLWPLPVSIHQLIIQFHQIMENVGSSNFYLNSGPYPSSCRQLKTRRFGDWILSPSSDGTYSVGPNRSGERERENISMYWAELNIYHLKTEKEFLLRKLVF